MTNSIQSDIDKIAQLEERIAQLEKTINTLSSNEKRTTLYEGYKVCNVNHDQVITCEDCAYDDGHLKPNVSCECGRSNDDNTPIGDYDFDT